MVEVDCTEVAAALNSHDMLLSRLCFLYSDIKTQATMHGFITFGSTERGCNSIAHKLAQLAQHGLTGIWNGTVPESILCFVLSDHVTPNSVVL
uniref:RNase H type-1 domain-containing protein n=1 Tax=Arundo donax TaxID=35708 RepID=A0A0A9BX55_ARUDO